MMPPTTQPQIFVNWRVPDRVFQWLSAGVVLLTWSLLIFAYPLLPARLPDATALKSWWAVFSPGIAQLILTALTWWLARQDAFRIHPDTRSPQLVLGPVQTLVKRLWRHLLVMTGLLVNLVFAYLALGTVQIGLGLATTQNRLAIFGLLGILLLLIVLYIVWIVRLTKTTPPGDQP